MQQIINQLYNFYLTLLNGRTVIANKFLFVIGIFVVILFIMLLVVYNNKNKKGKALDSARKALNKSKKHANSLLLQKQKGEQSLQTLNTELTDLKKKYNKLYSELKAENTKFVNLQENYATCSNDLEGKIEIINRLTKGVERLRQELIKEANTHRNELDRITDQMKTDYEALECKHIKAEKEIKSLALIIEDLRKKDEDSQYVINSQKNNIDQGNKLIDELQKRIQSLEDEAKNNDDIIKSKETELLDLKEQVNSLLSKGSKRRSNPFERLANW